MSTLPAGQTQPANWEHFPTQRKMQALFLLPYIYETKDFSGTENPYLEKILHSLQGLYEHLSEQFDLEVCWIETGNHLTREFLESTPFTITSISKDRARDLFLNREVDLIVANGWAVLDLIHNEKIPTLLHSGFLPSPLHFSKSVAHQKTLFTTPGRADFFLTYSQEEHQFLEQYQEVLGIKEFRSVLLKARKNSAVGTQLSKNKSFQEFLKDPLITPKRQSLVSRIDEHYQNRLETLRVDLNEQRESELLWMRKAFTQEIEKLLKEQEELRKTIEEQASSKSAQIDHSAQDARIQELEAREKQAQARIMDLESQLSESQAIQGPTNPAEVEELRKTVNDLHSKLQRYKSQVPFVMVQWSYDFILTYLVRLPLTILLLAYHIGTSLLHRYQMSRGSH